MRQIEVPVNEPKQRRAERWERRKLTGECSECRQPIERGALCRACEYDMTRPKGERGLWDELEGKGRN